MARAGPVKILTISDKVDPLIYSERIRDRFEDVDLVLSCGDLPGYYLDYIVSMLNKPLYYVFGNHGPQDMDQRTMDGWAGCTNLDTRVVNHQGLLIAGLEGSMRYNRRERYQYTEFQMGDKIRRMLPALVWNRLRWGRYLDVLITHAPPCGIHDAGDLCHRGFKSFLRFMDWFSPRYLIHGHMHLYMPNQPTRTIYKRTEVINTYGYRLLEIEVPPRPLESG